MKKIFIFLLGALLFFNFSAQAQGEPYFGIYGMYALPQGDYADTKGNDAGFAEAGFGGGLEYTRPLSIADGLSWCTSVSFIMNGHDADALAEDMGADPDGDFSMGNTFNIPLHTGLKYQTDLSSMSVYGLFQVGINYIIPGKAEMEVGGTYTMTGTMEFDPGTSMGITLGGGIILNEKFTVGFRYFSLGEADIDGTQSYEIKDGSTVIEEGKEDLEGEEIAAKFLAITVGINF